MITHLNEEFAKIWVDDDLPGVFCTITGPMLYPQLETVIRVEMGCLRELRKKHDKVYSVVNLFDCSVRVEAMVIHYIDTVMKRKYTSKLEHKFFVKPFDKTLSSSIVRLLALYRNQKVEMFNSFEDAMRALNNFRQNEINESGAGKSMLQAIRELVTF
ncbi:hypothetical protein WSM22_23350 [Cytophagales bacterium WSM2-2]|nr:hypothetical protein WSM22_23350 [Cytophagales bacterium WSM2-2]